MADDAANGTAPRLPLGNDDDASLQTERFRDTVDRLVQRVNLHEGREGGSGGGGGAHHDSSKLGPLTCAELGELSLLCSLAKTLPESTEAEPTGFATVEADQLGALTEMLDRHVNLATGVNLVQQAVKVIEEAETPSEVPQAVQKWIKQEGRAQVDVLRMGLEAASVVVFMAASQGVDRRATNEDAIEAAISLMRSHLQKNIIPALCQTHHSLESDKTTTSESSPSKRRRVATSGQANISKSLKPVYALILPTISAQILLVERLENLVRHIPLDDQQILMLTNPAIMVLEIDCNLLSPSSKSVSPAMVLQKTYTSLVTEAFRRYKLHRETILEDLFPIMLKLPTAKRSLRAFQISYAGVASPESFASFHAALLKDLLPNAAQPHCIQMITAMLLSLIQACVTRPNYEGADEEQDGQGNEGDDNKPAPVFVNGLQEAKMVVDVFCTQLLSRCSKKGCVLEFRPVLVNLVEDLLLCFMLPEYPAAELLLSRLLTLLTIDMKRSSASSKSKQTLETTYLNTAFDLVGKIGAVQARILSVHRDKALTVTNLATPMPMNEDDHVRMGCYCGDTSHEGRFALECDHCRVTFHGGCINYDNGTRDEEWFCDACKLGRLGEREKLKYKANGEELYVDDQYVLYQSFFSLLSHREGGTLKELQDATQMHLSRWAAFLNVQSQKLANKGTFAKPLRITHDLMNFWESPGPGAEPLSDEGTNRLILSLAVGTSQMLQCFHAQISIILQLMGDGSHTLRKLSLKAIEKTAEGDSSLMAMKQIISGVSNRFTDDSISVREAAISLVGSYMIKFPHVANSFHSSLLPCLNDAGVSVRKRAVKVFEEILSSNTSYQGRAQVCHVLLLRAADPKEEDSVRENIYDLFTRMWLGGRNDIVSVVQVKRPRDDATTEAESPNSVADIISEKSNLVTPTPTALDFGKTVQLKRSDIAAMQMMKVVRAGGTHEHLEKLLRALLDGTSVSKEKEKKKRAALDQKFRNELVNSLFELLLSVEEQRTARSSRMAKDIAATLQTIVTFTELAPQAVLKQVDMLLPYLKGDNGVCFEDEATIVAAVCDILHRLTCTLNNVAADRLSNAKVAKDIRGIICKFPESTIESAVRVWSVIIERESKSDSDFSSKFLGLFKSFYRHLATQTDEHDDFSSVRVQIRDSVHRSLTILRYICRFYGHKFAALDWDSEIDNATEDAPLPPAESLTWDDAGIASYRIFSRYLMKADPMTKCKALEGLSGMFIAAPRLMLKLEQIGLIDALMCDDAAIELQRESLRCFQSILVSEEKRIDGGEAKHKTESNHTLSERISGDQDGDSTIFGSILTNHADRLFEMTQAQDPFLRSASLELLEVLLRQGLVNPNDAVPYLFALQGDIANNSIRSHALRLLMTEAEKRPDMIRQRVCAGIKKAYEFQRTLNPDQTSVSALVEKHHGKITSFECIFDSVFIECIRSSAKQRHGLYRNLLSLFEVVKESGSGRGHSKSLDRVDLDLLSFSSQVLAHLPYNSVGDPLFIIYHISSTIAFQGSQLLDRLADVLRPVGLASDDELDETNVGEDALERAAKTKFPKNTQEAKALGSKDFDSKTFMTLCRDGAALTLLLRLKSHLRALYNLTETRCLEYDPLAKERICDKGVSKTDVRKPFVAQLHMNSKPKKSDIDSLIRQYADFRRLMREESASTGSASEAQLEAAESDEASDIENVKVPDEEME